MQSNDLLKSMFKLNNLVSCIVMSVPGWISIGGSNCWRTEKLPVSPHLYSTPKNILILYCEIKFKEFTGGEKKHFTFHSFVEMNI